MIVQPDGSVKETPSSDSEWWGLNAMALEPALRFQTYVAQAYTRLGDIHAALKASQEGLRLTLDWCRSEFSAQTDR
jgi:hypothetical protein